MSADDITRSSVITVKLNIYINLKVIVPSYQMIYLVTSGSTCITVPSHKAMRGLHARKVIGHISGATRRVEDLFLLHVQGKTGLLVSKVAHND